MGNQVNSKLIETFIASAKEAIATVEQIPADASSLNSALIAATEGKPVLLAPPEDIDQELLSMFMLNQYVIISPSKEQLSTVETGITTAFCAIASTGSVCISVTKSLSSSISMLVRKHIVILDGRNIVPKPRDVLSEACLGGKGLLCSFSMITGPSATADMGPLVRGVHGPGKLHIIILKHYDE